MSWNYSNVIVLMLVLLVQIQKNTALFEGCDYTYNVAAGYSYLESPYYPQNYPASSSCRYIMVAPLDHQIQIKCTINMASNGQTCSTEYFYISTEGDKLLRGSEQFCGNGTFSRNSLFRQAAFAYASYGGTGNFRCTLYVTKQPCDCGWYASTRIVNGQQANINEYPSMSHLSLVGSNQVYCAANIISHYHALTAAHCAEVQPDVSKILLKVGDHDISSSTETIYAAEHKVSRILKHPNYTQDPDRHDIAIIFTSTIIEWSRGVGPICLPPASSASNTYAYSYVDVIGWGTTSFAGAASKTLQKVTLMVLQNSDCQNVYKNTTIFADHICTYDYTGTRKDSCQRDSGGPVIRRLSRQFEVGLISFGDACGSTNYATGVNTRISSYLQWILANTGYSTCIVSM